MSPTFGSLGLDDGILFISSNNKKFSKIKFRQALDIWLDVGKHLSSVNIISFLEYLW